MTSWTEIPTTDIDQDSPVTQPLMTAYRDNIRAFAEAATDAPVSASGWNPYNQVDIGDGADGLIYDHSVDGTVATIETPDFELGYDYQLMFDELSSVSGTVDLYLECLSDIDSLWKAGLTIAGIITSGSGRAGRLSLLNPKNDDRPIELSGWAAVNTSSGSTTFSPEYAVFRSDTGAGKARLNLPSSSFDAGRVWLLRRWSGV